MAPAVRACDRPFGYAVPISQSIEVRRVSQGVETPRRVIRQGLPVTAAPPKEGALPGSTGGFRQPRPPASFGP